MSAAASGNWWGDISHPVAASVDQGRRGWQDKLSLLKRHTMRRAAQDATRRRSYDFHGVLPAGGLRGATTGDAALPPPPPTSRSDNLSVVRLGVVRCVRSWQYCPAGARFAHSLVLPPPLVRREPCAGGTTVCVCVCARMRITAGGCLGANTAVRAAGPPVHWS